jgi:hypothetical protein
MKEALVLLHIGLSTTSKTLRELKNAAQAGGVTEAADRIEDAIEAVDDAAVAVEDAAEETGNA